MLLDLDQRPSLAYRLRARHLPAAVLAAMASLGLHTGLLRLAPDLPVGRVRDLGSASVPLPTVLGAVHTVPPAGLDRPERFQPSDPAQASAALRDFEGYAEALAELMPGLPVEQALDAALGSEAPVAPAPEAVPEIPFSPRQEIVRIQERIFADEVALLPRQFTPDVARQSLAPDIALPVEPELAASLPAGPPAGLEPGLAEAGGIGWPLPGLGGAPPQPTGDAMLRETSALASEPEDAISELPPVEQLLRLDTSAFSSPGDPAVYFRLALHRAGPEALPVLPRDVLFIVDASHSMTQKKLDRFKEGLLAFLNTLGPRDRFNVMAFRDKVSWCFDAWTPAAGPAKTRARVFIEALKAQGRTDLFASLEPLGRIPREEGRPVVVVLATDGRPTMGMVDSSDIIVQLSRMNQGHVSIFALGGGSRVNRYLIEMLSFGNRGDSLIVPQDEDIPSALLEWGRQLGRPVLTDLRFRFTGMDEAEVYPKTLTPLFLDRPLEIYGRIENPSPSVGFRIVGLTGSQACDIVFPIDFAAAAPGDEHIRSQWARNKLYHLIALHIETRDPAVMARIHALARQYGLHVPYGSDLVPR